MLRTYNSGIDILSSSRALVEDTLHVPTMPAPELNSVQTVPQMGPESVSAVDAHCPEKLWTGELPGACVCSPVGAPTGCSGYAKYGFLVFFQTDKSQGKNLLPTPLFLRWEAEMGRTMGPLSAEISGHQRIQMLTAICNLSGRRASWVWKQWCPFASLTSFMLSACTVSRLHLFPQFPACVLFWAEH